MPTPAAAPCAPCDRPARRLRSVASCSAVSLLLPEEGATHPYLACANRKPQVMGRGTRGKQGSGRDLSEMRAVMIVQTGNQKIAVFMQSGWMQQAAKLPSSGLSLDAQHRHLKHCLTSHLQIRLHHQSTTFCSIGWVCLEGVTHLKTSFQRSP